MSTWFELGEPNTESSNIIQVVCGTWNKYNIEKIQKREREREEKEKMTTRRLVADVAENEIKRGERRGRKSKQKKCA